MIYLSTGGCFNNPAWRVSQEWIRNGIKNIELSGGLFDPNSLSELKKLKLEASFNLHNYFPPPEIPFVFNLASLNKDTMGRSIEHVRTAMRWAIELDSPVYSFHAGFLLDPKVEELGTRIARRALFDRCEALDQFIENVNLLAEVARHEGVELLIENNVISKNNMREFSGNPFLMADMSECIEVMSNTPDNVRLLVDVAHLKVSARSLEFDRVEFLNKCCPWIEAYHLSDNNGDSDSNEKVTERSWFWRHLKRSLGYYSLEIYNINDKEIGLQVLLASKML